MGTGILTMGPATMPPGTCFICACTPVDETKEDHPILPFIWPEGMDINWGETPYICMTCVGLMADMIDRPSAETVQKVFKGAKAQKTHNETLMAANKELQELVKGLLEGKDVTERAKELVNV